MAGFLAAVVVSDLRVIDASTGQLQVNITWTGQENSVDLHQIRSRWIGRTDKASRAAPNKSTAEAWAESTGLGTQGDFRYIDTIERATAGQQATSGTITEQNEEVTNVAFSNATVWVMARLEVA